MNSSSVQADVFVPAYLTRLMYFSLHCFPFLFLPSLALFSFWAMRLQFVEVCFLDSTKSLSKASYYMSLYLLVGSSWRAFYLVMKKIINFPTRIVKCLNKYKSFARFLEAFCDLFFQFAKSATFFSPKLPIWSLPAPVSSRKIISLFWGGWSLCL